MKDVLNRHDLELLIADFYEAMLKDPIVGFIFTDVAKINLEDHLPIIVDFWQDLLFQTYLYKNNPMQKHLDFHQKVKFEKHHFALWLQYLTETVDEDFEGENALNMKARASSIATVMQLKMDLYKS